MLKRDYFLKALEAECFRHKRWAFEAFSIVLFDPKNPPTHPYALQMDELGHWFVDPETGQRVYLKDTQPGQAAFQFKEPVQLKAGDVPNLFKDLTSTYGNLLVNRTTLCYAFGGKIPYMDGYIPVGRMEKLIEGRLQDEPAPGTARDPEALYVSEYKRFNESVLFLAGYSQLCVPSATERTMTTDPRVAIRRAELLEEYKDRLHDPVIQAKINNELIAIDREWIKGDRAEGFYIKDKSYNIVRKKIFLLQGAENGFGKQGNLIPTSLSEGWDIKNLPDMSNSLRDGSFNRGSQTMLGGEATKFNYRIFQNTSVAGEDCGSKRGLPIQLTKDNAKYYVSSSVITPQGPVELTEENLDKYVDKKVLMRSPIYCKASGANFCATCLGKKIASTPNAISTYAADIGSLFLGLFLSKMHGTTLSVGRWDPKTALR